MKISGIYSITNTINGKIYYGSSVYIQKRWLRHKNDLEKNKHKNIHLQRSYNKYGKDVFKFEVLLEVLAEQLLDTEQIYLNKVKEQPELYYNMALYAEAGMRGRKQSKETIAKRVLKLKGMVMSEEAKKKISLSHIGMLHSDVTKKKMSMTNKGKAPKDKNVYTFKNKTTNEEFTGIQYDFYTKYNLSQGKVNLIVNGKRNSHKNWILI